VVKLHAEGCGGIAPLLMQFSTAERLSFLLAVGEGDALA
jgi:hypothetical protein